MGGQALSFETRRLNPAQFDALTARVLVKCSKLFPRCLPTLFYNSKSSFGDLDLIVSKPRPDWEVLEEFIYQEFEAHEIYVNTDVVSFDYENFQIDLIFVPKTDFEVAHFYFSYNDLNNFVGRLAYRLDLRFGFDGLYYRVKEDYLEQKEEILLSKEPQKIYEFLDLEWHRYCEGFMELDQIFDFVTRSKYFKPEIFDYENLNHQNRTRNKKRKNYPKFLSWIELHRESLEKPEQYFDSDYILQKIEKHFPESNIYVKLAQIKEQHERTQALKKKFNGNIVKELIPDLEGPRLGKFIHDFKSSKPDFEDWVLESSPGEIYQAIHNFYDHGI